MCWVGGLTKCSPVQIRYCFLTPHNQESSSFARTRRDT